MVINSLAHEAMLGNEDREKAVRKKIEAKSFDFLKKNEGLFWGIKLGESSAFSLMLDIITKNLGHGPSFVDQSNGG